MGRLADAEVIAAIAAQRPQIAQTIEFVHAHPELGHEERACASHLTELLSAGGLAVERGLAGMETAFRATLKGGQPGRRVGVAVLYDAVAAVRPDGSTEAVHSCGHGPIAGAATGLALAVAPLRERLEGELVLIGCPADEIHAPGTATEGGGKLRTAEAGVWDDCDAALYAHPEFFDTVWRSSLWMRRDTFLLAGERSLRDDAPQPPLQALASLLRAADQTSRERLMIERLQLDGDVEEGTGLVLSGSVLLFAEQEAGIAEVAATLREAVGEAQWREGPVVCGVRSDEGVRAQVAGAFQAAGREFLADPPSLPFATDFGNVSRRVPAALIGLGRPGGWAFHTDEGAAQFASPAGVDAAVDLATVLALAVVRLTQPGAP